MQFTFTKAWGMAIGATALSAAFALPAAAADAPKAPTFAKDIAPIFRTSAKRVIVPTRSPRCR